ncbi:MAG: glycine cleavage system regulatory protein [Flavobacteriales bacterium]|jgi:glycine cleavage system regulatory protein
MQRFLILSITCDDKPGVVESLASLIEENKGNWLESRLTNLDGKFAGVVRIASSRDNADALKAALLDLSSPSFHIYCDIINKTEPQVSATCSTFTAVGPDRSGIIKELSQAFSQQGINVEELESRLSSMPYSGEPLFEVNGQISAPGNIDLGELQGRLNVVANDLGIDIELKS